MKPTVGTCSSLETFELAYHEADGWYVLASLETFELLTMKPMKPTVGTCSSLETFELLTMKPTVGTCSWIRLSF